MTNQRFIPALLAGCALVVLLGGLWVRRAAQRDGRAQPATSERSVASPTATPAPVAARPTAAVAPGHRLAGTVVGDARYAVIEMPDGTNDLFRPGQEVPGLGRLVDVESNRATFEGKDGRFDLRLVGAPTTTPVLLLRDTPPAAGATPTPPSSPSGSGSSPSGAPDRSAS